MTAIYIATGDDFALLRQTASGWRCQVTLAAAGIQCVAADPHDSQTVYVGSRGRGVFKSTDGGWQWVRLPFPEPDVFSVAVSPADGTVYAGCEPSRLFYSRDEGAHWVELETLQHIPSQPTWTFPPRPWTSHVRWIAPHPQEAHVLLVGIELGGVMFTDDRGKTWRDHPPGAIKDCHTVAWHPTDPKRAYETGGGGPAAYTDDGSMTWQLLTTGTDRTYGWGLALDAADPNHWFISASPSAAHAHRQDDAQAHIYRWHGNGPWEQVTSEPFESMPYALQLHNGILYAGFRDGTLQTSTDNGANWVLLSITGDPLTRVRAMVVPAM